MAQWLRALSSSKEHCSSKGPDFKFQQRHGGSQWSLLRSEILFWCV